MKKLLALMFVAFILFSSLIGAERELRGAWVAWAGSDIPSNYEIATTMNKLAEANFNMVYVDVWRAGYPYFKSEVFYEHTGYYTDENLGGDKPPVRDVLAEMIAEAHRVGISVEAWFEGGFSGGADTTSPLFQTKAEWFAKNQEGDLAFYGQAGPSMIHCHPEVQQFLIDLAQEVVQKYDIDGVQMDRIRYPSHNCGYDSITINLYKQENNGNSPPDYVSNRSWVQWRADKLTNFVGKLYDSLKAVNSDIVISNATATWTPINFCQDWSEWANNGYVDVLVPMLYYKTASYFTDQLENNSEITQVDNFQLIYPGLTTVANQEYIELEQLEAMIRTTRQKGLHGNVHWYHKNLINHENNYASYLKETVYQQPAAIPYLPRGIWRPPATIVNENDPNVNIIGNWNKLETNKYGYKPDILIKEDSVYGAVEYNVNIPFEAWFDVYAYIVRSPQATDQAKYKIYNQNDSSIVFLPQNSIYKQGWQFLKTVYLQEGNQKLIKIDNSNIDNDKWVIADAIMVTINRKKSYDVRIDSTQVNNVDEETNKAEKFFLYKNYPNPFNSSTTIKFSIDKPQQYILTIYNISGERVKLKFNKELQKGVHHFKLDMDDYPSGLYFYRLASKSSSMTRRMLLIK